MDNPVLIRVAAVLDGTLRQAVVREFRQDSPTRFRLVLADGDQIRSLAMSIDMARPWCGRPAGRGRLRPQSPGPFAAVAANRLRGAIVARVEKPPADRCLLLHFVDGQRLLAELVPHRSNLVLLDSRSKVVSAARRPRRARSRLQAGHPYEPEPLPSHLFDPFEATAAQLEERLRQGVASGSGVERCLGRDIAGIGPRAAELLVREAEACGRPVSSVVHERFRQLLAGEVEPSIESPSAAELDASALLLPWEPGWPPREGWERIRRDDAAATAGYYYESLERIAEAAATAAALTVMIEREVRRLRAVELRVAADADSFKEPDRYRLWAEALLAGLLSAKRVGGHVLVPDPYDTEGGLLSVPAPAGEPLSRVAESHFARHRRARRGLERARERATAVRERRLRLERLLELPQDGTPGAVAALQRAMQERGMPVGLEQSGRSAPRSRKPRLEGVRLFRTVAGDTVMVGKSGPDNQRLTFKLAGPEDFWLHAEGVPGAHVILRNERRAKQPDRSSLQEAAEAAAWFSEARKQPAADVQWTLRKYVRKLRGAPPGTVRIKKATTIRIRPCRPEALDLER